MKYSDWIAAYLKSRGFSICFSVGGGNIMHLVESISKQLDFVPVVHEVTAAIAAEHHQAISPEERALALVTTGPGLTNTVTAVASAYVESRPLVLFGGQVKTSDLSMGPERQIGIQEIKGTDLLSTITKLAIRVDAPLDSTALDSVLSSAFEGRPGPVYVEFPLDVQAMNVEFPLVTDIKPLGTQPRKPTISEPDLESVLSRLKRSRRPAILIGSGVTFETAIKLDNLLRRFDVPIFTSWNAADRYDNTAENYFGRPNTWGQRYSNVLIQQADLLIAVGARLGLQQTGFNWQEFIPHGRIIQIDIDASELEKKRPKIDTGYVVDANDFLERIGLALVTDEFKAEKISGWGEWLEHCRFVKNALPLSEATNSKHEGHWNPYDFYIELTEALKSGDVLLPSSSGSSFTSSYQSSTLKSGVRMISSKSLASMGYGLAAAIGAGLANKNGRTVLVEGDGGFAQNLQDLGTAIRNCKNLKVFIWNNDGYASIRKTQQSYFGGNYVGCDLNTGLVLPDWEMLCKAFGAPVSVLRPDQDIASELSREGNMVFIVPIHPEQTFFPKINSRITEEGTMKSNPLHVMFPELEKRLMSEVCKYMNA